MLYKVIDTNTLYEERGMVKVYDSTLGIYEEVDLMVKALEK